MSETISIATFNVNSIRSRLEVVLNWMDTSGCDVLCVQETKVQDIDFPKDAFESAGLYCIFHGQKTYNGVAIISKIEPVNICTQRTDADQEARLIRAEYDGITVVNTYIPQGTAVGTDRFAYKLEWLKGMREYLDAEFTPEDQIVWVGDLNVAREPIDVYDPEGLAGSVCFHPDEQASLDYVMDWGMVDVFRKHHPNEPNQFSFWDYRIPNAVKRRMGWRLDHVMATIPLAEKSVKCDVDKTPRLQPKSSDHTPVVAVFGK